MARLSDVDDGLPRLPANRAAWHTLSDEAVPDKYESCERGQRKNVPATSTVPAAKVVNAPTASTMFTTRVWLPAANTVVAWLCCDSCCCVSPAKKRSNVSKAQQRALPSIRNSYCRGSLPPGSTQPAHS